MLIYVYVYASYSYINHTIDMYASTIFHAKEGKRIQRILSHCRFETSADFSIHSKYLWKNEVPLKVPSSGNVQFFPHAFKLYPGKMFLRLTWHSHTYKRKHIIIALCILPGQHRAIFSTISYYVNLKHKIKNQIYGKKRE